MDNVTNELWILFGEDIMATICSLHTIGGGGWNLRDVQIRLKRPEGETVELDWTASQ